MSSIHPDYEYDIFISYRQNDNKRDGWVTNFVEALKDELDTTLKNPVSIYFDENPHDGLLETHQVDASLAKKLKCLVFIPIISQTYCDESSFAWQHEFLPFIEMAREDDLGMNITLANGNVASRVLPMKIHDLDVEDEQLLKEVLGGSLRSIDFIYKEPGVNRPLRAVDNEEKNLNKSLYRNQINKAANALKDIGSSIIRIGKGPTTKIKIAPISPSPKKFNKMWMAVFLAFVLISLLGYWSYTNYNIPKEAEDAEEVIKEKSLAVLPFSNTKPDPETDYLGFAIANQVIGELAYLKDITVRPSASIRKYANQINDPITVGDELSVDYILIGNYLNEFDSIRLTIELVEVNTNEMIWREEISIDFHNAFDLQDIVAQKVVKGLDVQLSPNELNKINRDIPSNPLAYEYYLRSISYPLSNIGDRLAIEMLNKSIELDSNYAPVYSHLALRTQLLAQFALMSPIEKKNAEKYYLKALSLNENLLTAQGDLAMLFTETGRIEEAVILARRMLKINPNNAAAHFSLSYIYRYSGMMTESIEELEKAISLDPKNPRFRRLGLAYLYVGEYKKAYKVFEIDKGSAYSLAMQSNILIRQGKNIEAISLINSVIIMEEEKLWMLVATVQKAFIEGNINQGLKAMHELEQHDVDDGEAWYYWASYYGMLEDRDGSIRAMRKAIDTGFFCYPFMVNDTFLDFAREDPEYQELLTVAKKKHEAFKEKFF